jgi:hypothetical protein
MAAQNVARYQPSGFFRPTTIVGFAAAIVVAALLAWLYQLLARWIPIIYLNILLCIGFAACVGGLGMFAVRAGHCRNRAVALVLALPLAGGAVAATYYWDYQHLLSVAQEKFPDVSRDEIRRELTFRRYLDGKQETGWSVSSHGGTGTQMNGVVVLVVWGIEALIIGVLGVMMAWIAAGDPYCERCNRWTDEKKLTLPGIGREAVDPLLERADLSAVVALTPPAEPADPVALAFTVKLCPACRETGFLTIEEKRLIAKKKAKPEEKSTELVTHAVLRADQRAQLERRIATVAPPPAAAAAG